MYINISDFSLNYIFSYRELNICTHYNYHYLAEIKVCALYGVRVRVREERTGEHTLVPYNYYVITV